MKNSNSNSNVYTVHKGIPNRFQEDLLLFILFVYIFFILFLFIKKKKL